MDTIAIDSERSCEEVRKVMEDYLSFIWNIKMIVMEKKVITETEKENQLCEISALITSEELVKQYFEYKEKFSVCYDNPLLNVKHSGMKA